MMKTTSPSTSTSLLDRPVKATGDDAMVAKIATSQTGYYEDPFLDAFCGSGDNGNGAHNNINNGSRTRTAGRSSVPGAGTVPTSNGRRRTVQPIIKRGTHARVCVVDRAITAFLKFKHKREAEAAACQVVVLGSGKDTSYFRFRNQNLMGMEDDDERPAGEKTTTRSRQRRGPHPCQQTVHWYEVDHVSVIKEKASLIRKSSLLKSHCPMFIKTENGYESTGGGTSSLRSFSGSSSSSPSSTYHLIGHDLRDSPSLLFEKLDLNPRLPTLFVMECVSMYVPITASQNLLQALSVSVDTVFLACYEPILDGDSSKGGDPFGKVMERNLVKRGVASPDSCLLQTRTLRDQLHKLLGCKGFVRAVGCDMWSAYQTIVTAAQRKRANESEFMDEYEEWILIMRHYCFVVARGGLSPFTRHNPEHDLTRVFCKYNDENRTRSPLGWVSDMCLEVEK